MCFLGNQNLVGDSNTSRLLDSPADYHENTLNFDPWPPTVATTLRWLKSGMQLPFKKKKGTFSKAQRKSGARQPKHHGTWYPQWYLRCGIRYWGYQSDYGLNCGWRCSSLKLHSFSLEKWLTQNLDADCLEHESFRNTGVQGLSEGVSEHRGVGT